MVLRAGKVAQAQQLGMAMAKGLVCSGCKKTIVDHDMYHQSTRYSGISQENGFWFSHKEI